MWYGILEDPFSHKAYIYSGIAKNWNFFGGGGGGVVYFTFAFLFFV